MENFKHVREAAAGRLAERPWTAFSVFALLLLGIKLYGVILMADLPLFGDEASYLDMSRTFFQTYWEKGDYWAPLQTLFLATVRIIDYDFTVYTARVIQLIVHSLTAAIIVLIGRELENERVGFTAGALFLVLPEVVSMAYLLFAETWSMFFFFGAVLFYILALKHDRLLHFAIAGFGFGMAAMFRSINLYFSASMLAHFWVYAGRTNARKLALMATLFAAMCIPISIQTVKNYHVYDEFLPIDTCGAENTWRSHNVFPPPNYDYGKPWEFNIAKSYGFPGARPRAGTVSPASRQRIELKNALIFIANNPGLTAMRTMRKIDALFYPAFFVYRNFSRSDPRLFTGRYLNSPAFRATGSISYMIMMMLSVAGLIFCHEAKIRNFTLLLLAYNLGMNGFFFAVSRYRLAFVPLLIVFMAWTLNHLKDIWDEKRSWKVGLVLLIWAIMLLTWIPDLFEVIPTVPLR